MDRLSPREQRLAALFLLVAAVALVWLLLIRPVASGFADRAARRDLLLATYQRDERVIGQLPSLTRATSAQRAEAGRFRLPAVDEAGATALVSRRLGAAVAAAGGTVAALEPVAGGPGIVRVRLDVRLDPARLAAFLGDVQNGLPILMVDGGSVGDHTEDGEPASGLLDVHLDVSAFFSPRPTPAAG